MKPIRIEKTGINGEGIGYVSNKPIFIMGALPNEVVEVDRVVDHGRYLKAQLKSVLTQSPQRVKVRCAIQKRCGGCALMPASYPEQSRIKLEHLRQSLQKYGVRLDAERLRPLLSNPEPFHYRNQAKMPIGYERNNLLSGFYARETNHLVVVETCHVHDVELERLRLHILKVLNRHRIRAYVDDRQGLRTLVLRVIGDQAQCTLVTGKMQFKPEVVEDLMKIEGLISLGQSIQTSKNTHETFGKEWTRLAGQSALNFNFLGLNLKLKAKAFFQLNTLQAERLFEQVLAWMPAGQRVADVYCGVGALSLALARTAKQVIGIELSKDAIDSASENAKLNRVTNISFLHGDAAQILVDVSKQIDVVVLDPPRSGLDEAMIEMLMKKPFKQLIYVSCNPSTLAKNLAELQKKYRIEGIQPLDMFSQTPHLECAVLMTRT
jgi:23S rRNA (uracil1939-C5)-methyltransferase